MALKAVSSYAVSHTHAERKRERERERENTQLTQVRQVLPWSPGLLDLLLELGLFAVEEWPD